MNSKQKELVVIFIFLFIFSFIILNWNVLSWMFNYREVGGLVYDFFNPYQDSNLLAVAQGDEADPGILINNQTSSNSGQVIAEESVQYNFSDSINTLSIPTLSISAPVVIGQTTNTVDLEVALDKGAVFYPGSVLPGQTGQMVILGHSAPPGWPKIKYDWIFSNISQLEAGSTIVLTFGDKEYTYRVVHKKIVKPGQIIGDDQLASKNNVLTLVSCWPPGKSTQRITVTAELVK